MPETVHTGKRRVIRLVLRNGIAVTAAAFAAVAFVTPAHAEDSSTAAPLLLGESAAIPPEDTPALPADVTPPVDPSIDVGSPQAQKIPAKSTRAGRPGKVADVHTATLRAVREVISSERASSRAAARNGRAKPVAGWYQISERQYRSARAQSRSTHVSASSPATARGEAHAAATAGTTSENRRGAPPSASDKCVRLCAADRRYNASWNVSGIDSCISALPSHPGRGRLCELMLERLRVLLATEAATRSTTQYQPAGTQYQTSAVTATPADASAGWELFRPAAKRAIHIVHAAPSEIAATSPRSGSPYVRAAIPVEQRDAAVRERDPARLAEPATQAARRGAAAPVAERTGASSTDWLVRTLLVLLGAAILSLVVLGLGGLDVVAQAVGGLGSRLRSRGLGTSRIVLGAHSARRTERHDDGIRYRD